MPPRFYQVYPKLIRYLNDDCRHMKNTSFKDDANDVLNIAFNGDGTLKETGLKILNMNKKHVWIEVGRKK